MKAVYEFVLEARDQGTAQHVARVLIRISVLDVNDNSPKIVDPQNDIIAIHEDQLPGTAVAQVRACDNDFGENASITYSMITGTECLCTNVSKNRIFAV